MCCETCPHYKECESAGELIEECCSQCPYQNYCTSEEGSIYKENFRRHTDKDIMDEEMN